MSNQVNFLEYIYDKIENFIQFSGFIDMKTITEAQLEEYKKDVLTYMIKHLPKLRSDIIRYEVNYYAEKFDSDSERDKPAQYEEYDKVFTFEKFGAVLFGDNAGNYLKEEIEIKSILFSQVIDSFIPTIGIIISNPEMVESPKDVFERKFRSYVDKIKLFRYLDCFYDVVSTM